MKKFFTIIFVLLLLSITTNSYAISKKEAKQWIGKNVLIIQDGLIPSGTFCEVIDVIEARDGDIYIVAHLYKKNLRELRWIEIKSVLKISEWNKKVIYESSPSGVRYDLDRYSPEYLRRKYRW